MNDVPLHVSRPGSRYGASASKISSGVTQMGLARREKEITPHRRSDENLPSVPGR